MRINLLLIMILCLLASACGGAEPTSDSTSDSTGDISTDAGADTASDADDDTATTQTGFCTPLIDLSDLVGDVLEAEPGSEQEVDAVELMGQTVLALRDAGAPAEVVAAAEAVHAQYAEPLNSGGEPDQTVLDEAYDTLRPYIEDCGFGPEPDADVAIDQVDRPEDAVCVAALDIQAATATFVQAEQGSVAEQDAVAEIEQAAFALADAAADLYPDAVESGFAVFEGAQRFVETGELQDDAAAGAPLADLIARCS